PPILVTCSTGRRSFFAVRVGRARGFTTGFGRKVDFAVGVTEGFAVGEVGGFAVGDGFGVGSIRLSGGSSILTCWRGADRATGSLPTSPFPADAPVQNAATSALAASTEAALLAPFTGPHRSLCAPSPEWPRRTCGPSPGPRGPHGSRPLGAFRRPSPLPRRAVPEWARASWRSTPWPPGPARRRG